MKTTSRRTQRDYSLAFKLAVVSQVEKGEMTYKVAQELIWNSRLLHGFSLASQAWSSKLV